MACDGARERVPKRSYVHFSGQSHVYRSTAGSPTIDDGLAVGERGGALDVDALEGVLERWVEVVWIVMVGGGVREFYRGPHRARVVKRWVIESEDARVRLGEKRQQGFDSLRVLFARGMKQRLLSQRRDHFGSREGGVRDLERDHV